MIHLTKRVLFSLNIGYIRAVLKITHDTLTRDTCTGLGLEELGANL